MFPLDAIVLDHGPEQAVIGVENSHGSQNCVPALERVEADTPLGIGAALAFFPEVPGTALSLIHLPATLFPRQRQGQRKASDTSLGVNKRKGLCVQLPLAFVYKACFIREAGAPARRKGKVATGPLVPPPAWAGGSDVALIAFALAVLAGAIMLLTHGGELLFPFVFLF